MELKLGILVFMVYGWLDNVLIFIKLVLEIVCIVVVIVIDLVGYGKFGYWLVG